MRLERLVKMMFQLPGKISRFWKTNLDKIMETNERYWKQRAKVDWLRNRDRNTRFFHSKASARKSRNKLKGLFDDSGIWRDSNHDLKRIVGQYFSEIFYSGYPSQLALGKVLEGIHLKLDNNMSRFLNSKFSGEDVNRVVLDMHPTKALGSDGLPTDFYQK
ncbi:hypothetical protein Dsin_016343 [Dipteronia sinensis]|uniref:Reverse transcriptase n=1 Tax=Dipteronia sinensis TaxID=43782 RepID=A0AAE0AE70_9ROSI|nr:hypothetical protein Dsin_016343 [Dipteronia sinensis]